MGIPDHLTCLLRNMNAGPEAAVRTRPRSMGWFKIGKGVCQACILSPCLFNFSADSCAMLSRSFWLFVTLWSVACQAPLSMGILQVRILDWIVMPSSRGSSQPGDLPNPVIEPRPPALQADFFFFFYFLSYQGSPRILEWVAYPFSRGSSWPRNQTRIFCIAGTFFTSWGPGKPVCRLCHVKCQAGWITS